MYGKSPVKIPIILGGSTLPTTGLRGFLLAEIALVLLVTGLVLLRTAAVRRARVSS